MTSRERSARTCSLLMVRYPNGPTPTRPQTPWVVVVRPLPRETPAPAICLFLAPRLSPLPLKGGPTAGRARITAQSQNRKGPQCQATRSCRDRYGHMSKTPIAPLLHTWRSRIRWRPSSGTPYEQKRADAGHRHTPSAPRTRCRRDARGGEARCRARLRPAQFHEQVIGAAGCRCGCVYGEARRFTTSNRAGVLSTWHAGRAASIRSGNNACS